MIPVYCDYVVIHASSVHDTLYLGWLIFLTHDSNTTDVDVHHGGSDSWCSSAGTEANRQCVNEMWLLLLYNQRFQLEMQNGKK